MNNPVVAPDSRDDAIVALVLEKQGLLKRLEDDQEERERLQSLIEELKKNAESSAPFFAFTRRVEEAFAEGRIPLPADILKRKLPITVSYQTFFDNRSVRVSATFSVASSSYTVDFDFYPIPMDGQRGDNRYYPDFQMRYEKPPTLKKRKTGVAMASNVRASKT